MLYDRYSPALLGQIINVVGDQKVAEEVLQSTMLKIWNGISSYNENKAGLYAWMSRIARNAAIDKGRLKSFQNNQKTEELKPYVYSLNARSQDASKIDTDRLLKNLDEKHRVVIDYVYLMGYTQAEAAKALDMPLGTVKTRLRSAISLLRNELKDEKKLFIGMFMLLLILLFAMLT